MFGECSQSLTLGKTCDLCLGPARVGDGSLSPGGQGRDVLGEYLEIRQRVRIIAPGTCHSEVITDKENQKEENYSTKLTDLN